MSANPPTYLHRWKTPLVAVIVFALLSVACAIGASPFTPTPRFTPTSSQRPTVAIQAPQNNADVVVNTPITVQANALHPNGVTRLELRANQQQVDSKVSQNPLGEPNFAAYLNYTPTISGQLVLQVIAYSGNVASEPATITLQVKQQAGQVTATVAIPIGATQNFTTDPTCRARVEVNGLNFRQGPGVNYPPYQVLSLGTSIPLTGKLADLSWWQGRIGNTLGWVSASFVTVSGSLCNTLPVVLPPPSPVPSNTPTNTPQQNAPSQTPTLALPDLVIVKIEGPVSVILDGDNTKVATYKVTVQNTGKATTGQFNTGIVLADGTLRDMGAVSALAPNQQAIFETSIRFTSPGTVRLSAFVDTNQAVNEANEVNNINAFDVVLIKPTPQLLTITPSFTVAVTLTPTLTATSSTP